LRNFRKELAEYALLKSEAEQALKQPQAAIKTLSSAIASQPKVLCCTIFAAWRP
jgi:hypothetical protein